MMRFQVPPRADSLNHTPIRHVNNLLLKLIDGKGIKALNPVIITGSRTEMTMKLIVGLKRMAYRSFGTTWKRAEIYLIMKSR
jgi:hypothetical protein